MERGGGMAEISRLSAVGLLASLFPGMIRWKILVPNILKIVKRTQLAW